MGELAVAAAPIVKHNYREGPQNQHQMADVHTFSLSQILIILMARSETLGRFQLPPQQCSTLLIQHGARGNRANKSRIGKHGAIFSNFFFHYFNYQLPSWVIGPSKRQQVLTTKSHGIYSDKDIKRLGTCT